MSISLAIALLYSGPLAAPLENGNILYLSFVTDAPKRRAWRPDGTLAPSFLTKDLTGEPDRLPSAIRDDELEVELTLQLLHQPKDFTSPSGARYIWQPTFAPIGAASASPLGVLTSAVQAGKNTFLCGRTFRKPSNGKAFSLTVRLADTQWKTVASASFRKEAKVNGSDFISAPALVPNIPQKLGKAFPVHIPSKWRADDFRLMGFDSAGEPHPSGGELRIPTGQEFTWFTCPTQQIVRIELQARPFKSVVFRGIQPRPKD